MAAYAPLSKRIFGASDIHASLRLLFANMLVYSRLAFNARTWVATARVLRIVNAPCMRVLRRVNGNMRFSSGAVSDREVRERIKQPSIDCVLLRRRLLYIGRLVSRKPQALLALLRARPGGKPLPWAAQSYDDLGFFYELVLRTTAFPLQHPSVAIELWPDWIASNLSLWSEWVARVFFIESILDTVGSPGLVQASFTCALCPAAGAPAFTSHKALAQHMRIAHHGRSPMRA